VYRSGDELLGIAGWSAALFEPLLLRGRPVGVLTVFWNSEPAVVPERALQLIEPLSSEAAVAIERTTTLTELEKLTRVDALTGIGNRHAFDEQLGRELKRAEREAPRSRSRCSTSTTSRPTTTHTAIPRATGCCGRIAGAWQACLRATDSLARYGGEEFALIAPGCSQDEAVALVDRLRAAVTADQTCSAGVALWDRAETPPSCWHAPTRRSTRPSSPDATVPGSLMGSSDSRTCGHFTSAGGTAPAPTEG
jgi:GGDEF domain-containing protein